jgi:hypothetical protein
MRKTLIFHAAILLLALAREASAQQVGLGGKLGIPFNDMFESDYAGTPGRFLASGTRFVAGPSLEVRALRGFGVEFDLLFRRFDQTAPSVSSGAVSRTGRSWETPILAKYVFGSSRLRPFVSGGATFLRVSDYLTTYRNLPSVPAEQPAVSFTRAGFVVGGGLEWRAGMLRIAPQIRGSRWAAHDALPTADGNSIDFLVGISLWPR